MKLKFHSRDGHTVYWPNTKAPGQFARCVGRTFDAGKRAYIADKEPSEVDSDHHDAPHLIRQCQKGGLFAADAATAAFCGVELVTISQDTDGEWIRATAKAPSSPNKKPERAEG
jgi:hypothetical protein